MSETAFHSLVDSLSTAFLPKAAPGLGQDSRADKLGKEEDLLAGLGGRVAGWWVQGELLAEMQHGSVNIVTVLSNAINAGARCADESGGVALGVVTIVPCRVDGLEPGTGGGVNRLHPEIFGKTCNILFAANQPAQGLSRVGSQAATVP